MDCDMMSYFDDEKISIPVTRKTPSLVNGKTQPPSEGSVGPFQGIFFKASQAKNLIAEKLREKTDAVAVFDYGTDVKTKDILTVSSKKYVAINDDNVAEQNDVLVISLQAVN